MDCQDLSKRLQSLETQRQNLNNVLELVEKFVVPFRGKFFAPESSEEEVEWRKRDKYDDTAVLAAQTLASSMQGSLTSPAFKWFSGKFRNDELNHEDEAKTWLEECMNSVYHILQDSDFNLEASEIYLDLVSFGTGFIIEEAEHDDAGNFVGIDFSSIPMKECYYELDHKGNIIKFYRVVKWTASQIASKFGTDKLPQKVQDALKSPGKVGDKFTIVFAIYDEPKNAKADISSLLANDARPYQYKYFLKDSGEQLGETGGYYEMPVYAPRWRKVSGSKWGYSPAMVVLGDIMTLNSLTEMTLEALAKVIDPATLTTERGLISDLDLQAGGLTVVRNMNDVQPFESRARFDVGELKIERLQFSINRAFYVDQLQLKESPAMTATEVQVRYELMQRLLGPTLGRLENDFLNPLIQRTFNILLREGVLPPIPESVKLLGGNIDIEYIGPLSRAQKMDEVNTTNQWLGSMAQYIEIFPEVRDIPDIDAISRGTGNMMGVPARFMKDSKTVDEERKQRAQQEQLQREMAMMQQGGEAMSAMGEGMEKMK